MFIQIWKDQEKMASKEKNKQNKVRIKREKTGGNTTKVSLDPTCLSTRPAAGTTDHMCTV